MMKRTHSSLMNDLKVDPKIVADQLGHTLDVSQNIYTQSTLGERRPWTRWNQRGVFWRTAKIRVPLSC